MCSSNQIRKFLFFSIFLENGGERLRVLGVRKKKKEKEKRKKKKEKREKLKNPDLEIRPWKLNTLKKDCSLSSG